MTRKKLVAELMRPVTLKNFIHLMKSISLVCLTMLSGLLIALWIQNPTIWRGPYCLLILLILIIFFKPKLRFRISSAALAFASVYGFVILFSLGLKEENDLLFKDNQFIYQFIIYLLFGLISFIINKWKKI